MKKYKVMEVKNGLISSPSKFQGYQYGCLKDVIGTEYTCDNFDISNVQCSSGYYATDIDGLIYSNLSNDKKVFEVNVSGREKIFDAYKQRFEHIKFIRQIPMSEVKRKVKKESNKMDWNYFNALFPYNPLLKQRVRIYKKEIELLKKWDSVRASVRDSVRASVWDSVRASVRDSVWAYTSSLFPNIKKWNYINHKKGVNPFQPCIDLWHKSLVPSFDGKAWRLHTGPEAKIIYEMEE